MKVNSFEQAGISRIYLYSLPEIFRLRSFTQKWVSDNFRNQGITEPFLKNISRYHQWASRNSIPHERLFSAPFRFCTPPEAIKEILINKNLSNLFDALALKNPKVIDEGMGWLGYRMIRPGMNDGYPISCKNWGASKGAFSIWLHLYTFGSKYSLRFVKGSHQKITRTIFLKMGNLQKMNYVLIQVKKLI